MAKIEDKDLERLRKLKRSRCVVCQSPQSYINPMAKCFECKKKFCFSHIWSGQINKTMNNSEELRDVCKECKLKFNYRDLSTNKQNYETSY